MGLSLTQQSGPYPWRICMKSVNRVQHSLTLYCWRQRQGSRPRAGFLFVFFVPGSPMPPYLLHYLRPWSISTLNSESSLVTCPGVCCLLRDAGMHYGRQLVPGTSRLGCVREGHLSVNRLLSQFELRNQKIGCLGGSFVGCLPSAWVTVPGSWDQALHWAPTQGGVCFFLFLCSSWAHVFSLSLSPPPSYINK